MTIFTHHVQFWAGLFTGGTLGYVYGAKVKADILSELEAAHAWIELVKSGKLKVGI